MDEQARAGDAGLARGGEDARDDAVGSRLEVGVGEYELRRLAAELERHPTDVLGGTLGDVDPRPRRSRERDLVDPRVARERAADFGAVPCDDVEDAGREAGLGDPLGKLESGD